MTMVTSNTHSRVIRKGSLSQKGLWRTFSGAICSPVRSRRELLANQALHFAHNVPDAVMGLMYSDPHLEQMKSAGLSGSSLFDPR